MSSDSHKGLNLTLTFCFLAALCEGFDVQAAGVAAGGLSREFSPTPEQLGLFFSAGNFGLFLGAVIGGRLADRWGRKAVLVGSITIFGLFSLLTAAGWSMESLTWMRTLTGIGLGGAMPNLIALASESSKGGSRNARIATTFIGMPIGAAVASLVILFVAVEQWRWVFILGGVLPLLIATAMALRMPSTPPTERQHAPAIAELLGPTKVYRTALIWVGFFLMQLTLNLALNWLPLLMQARGLSKSEAAFAQMGFNVIGAAAALLMGVMLDARYRLAAITVAVLALPVILLSLAHSPAHSGLLMLLAALMGGGVLAFQVILYGVADRTYPAAVRGAGIGAAVGVGRLGAIAGPAFAALLIGAGRTPQQVLAGVLPVTLVCAVCVAILGWREFKNPT